ncbi:ABC transporter ATP-binding protein [Desulfitobacterium chlororespirans]|uniref:Amino acid/amide ABC transporter ATP-binding protein 1, HAAT family (TC 3.A.1.4.-) n=1 Tax=Desulfitobacterium chlororespirans DSM 11544 TaxID=1121395 RepID=A0A1M7SHE9_9FIRM|nr:ABC transporter ATP-binding protein [Desulfitobacterium chlororespirans]SHN57792.1 amino acid/amide ABC transporter ATP-binding protein 1, HAAT family (TC 3.A.1.4.-) [Desulfitobacterium chlororespirans DSM 11544]
MALLKIKKLTKAFGGLIAVNQVDFEMNEGQIASIIGPNGAGKTTFFNIISGYYPGFEGSITFDGQGLVKLTPEKVARHRIARTFQNIRLFPEMLAVENIMVGMHMDLKASIFKIVLHSGSMQREEGGAYERAVELLDYVGLESRRNELAKNLAYGEQRRLEIARALAMKPKLLLLDEPAAGLNPKETEELTHFIGKLRDDFGCAILLIEHDMKLVMEISDKVAVLNYGQKIAEGTPDEVKNNPAVIEAYLGIEDDDEEAV